jgi:3-hydroxy-9,10-secoandrosta-1,3,5(10)-triene-9,17-dione monooxygenase
VKDLTPVLRGIKERAQCAERERRIPDASMCDIVATGIIRAFTPRQYGGSDCELLTLFDGLVGLAQACPSTGWVASLLTIHNFIVSSFHVRAQREVWADGPDSLVASSVAPSGVANRVEGGFTLRGVWSFASGVDHCSWAVLTSLLRDNLKEASTAHFFLVPARDYCIIDDWYVSGLRATGSKSIEIGRDTFVPFYRAITLNELTARKSPPSQEGEWFRSIPWQPLFSYAFVPPAIGAALATLRAFREQLASRTAPYSGAAFRYRSTSLVRLARAASEVDMARLILRRDLEEMQETAHSGHLLLDASIERMLFSVAHIVECCSHAVDRLFAGSGGRALYEINPLQRLFRDMHAITQHAVVDIDVAGERFGKALLDEIRT